MRSIEQQNRLDILLMREPTKNDVDRNSALFGELDSRCMKFRFNCTYLYVMKEKSCDVL